MKQLLVLFLMWISIGIAISANQVIVENPSFDFNTSSNVTIQRIVLDDSSTTLYMVVYQRRGQWIRIASDSYINAGGKKLMLQTAEGIQLDQEVYPDESEKIIFSLVFPPIDPATQQIDFIESDCDNCFKTYGIRLNPDVQSKKTEVPKKIRDAAIVKDDGKPMPIPQLKSGDAVLKGGFIGYAPVMKWKVNVYVDNPVTGIQEELETNVKEDGSFELQIPLVTSMQVLLRIPTGMWYNKYILLTPGKESSVYFDLQQKSCQETPIESLKCPAAKYVWFGGANAEINNQIEDMDLAGLLSQTLYNQDDDNAVAGMTAGQYKSYILDKTAALINDLAKKGLTKKALEFASLSVRYTAANQLMFTQSDIQSAFRRSHNLSYDDRLTGFTLPEIDEDFYSFLKELSINDPYSLYFHDYGNIINSCKYLKMNSKEIRIDYISKDDFQALINSGKLLPEELEIAVYMRDSAMDNNDSHYKELEKQNSVMLMQEVISTGKLNDEQLEQVNKFLSLCTDPATTRLIAMEEMIRIRSKLSDDGALSSEEFNDIIVKIEESQNKMMPDNISPEQVTAFYRKYHEIFDRKMEEQRLKELKSNLGRILGTDKGIALELMETQLASAKMEKFTPMTDDELKAFFQMKNRFYFDYLTAKNNELLAQIEKNKSKGEYTIYDTPETEGEQAFSEIVKKFEGKVILVDFWNTWCGPCRSAMKEFEPSKNAFKEKGVVFIYLADESSPLSEWNNMLSNIPGEHFRLKDSQMKEIKKKFGIKGIPSYLILNRQGEQIYFKTGFYGSEIGNKLTEALKP